MLLRFFGLCVLAFEIRKRYVKGLVPKAEVRQNTCKGSLLRVGFGFISPNGRGALTRSSRHITQGSKRIPIHLLLSERSQRYRDR
jgi:hypothetical protein